LVLVTETRIGSYDDAPESEVSTVLQVPLLWRQYGLLPDHLGAADASEGTTARRRTNGAGRKHRTVGRHRAPEARPEPPETVAVKTVTRPRQPRVSQRDARSDAQRAALVHTLRVGLISAVLVLALFVAALLVLALWLP